MPRVGGQYAFFREAFNPLVAFLYGWALLLHHPVGSDGGGGGGLRRVPGPPGGAPAGADLARRRPCSSASRPSTPWGSSRGPCCSTSSPSPRPWRSRRWSSAPSSSPATPAWSWEPTVPAEPPSAACRSLSAFFAGLVPAMFAYAGWQNLNYVAEEVKNPQRNLPRAILIGVVCVIVVYVGANIAYVHVLGAPALAATRTPAADVAERLARRTRRPRHQPADRGLDLRVPQPLAPRRAAGLLRHGRRRPVLPLARRARRRASGRPPRRSCSRAAWPASSRSPAPTTGCSPTPRSPTGPSSPSPARPSWSSAASCRTRRAPSGARLALVPLLFTLTGAGSWSTSSSPTRERLRWAPRSCPGGAGLSLLALPWRRGGDTGGAVWMKGSVYMRWAKEHAAARYNLANSGLLPCTAGELGWRLGAGLVNGPTRTAIRRCSKPSARATASAPARCRRAGGLGSELPRLRRAGRAGGRGARRTAHLRAAARRPRPAGSPGAALPPPLRRTASGWTSTTLRRSSREGRPRLVVLTDPHNPSGVLLPLRSWRRPPASPPKPAPTC